jgi:hypothetical protein
MPSSISRGDRRMIGDREATAAGTGRSRQAADASPTFLS